MEPLPVTSQVGFTKKYVKEALRIVLVERDPEKAERYAQSCVVNVRDSAARIWMDDEETLRRRASGELLGLDDFIESGSLDAKRRLTDYADSAPAAVEVVRRLAKVNPDAVPEGGARVDFCIAAGPSTVLKTKRAFSPDDARDMKLHLDIEHYTQVAIKKLSDVLYPVFAEKARREGIKVAPITSFFARRDGGVPPGGIGAESVRVQASKRKSDRDKPDGRLYIERKLADMVYKNPHKKPRS